MSKVLMSIHVQGKAKKWAFDFYGDPENWPEWEADGLEVYQVENIVPLWVQQAGATRLWCFLQDLFYFKPVKAVVKLLSGRTKGPEE
jgi:hypothetical protein